MRQKEIIGKIRDRRKKMKMSLDHLSRLTGLSKGYLSKIENSANLPPISTLHRIASALGTSLTVLFDESGEEERKENITVVRRQGRKEYTVGIGGTIFKHWPLASAKSGRNMDPYIIEIPPDNYQVYQHEGEEFYFVLEGKIELHYGGRNYLLEEGDSIYFDTNIPHSGRSVGDKPARALVLFYNYKKVFRKPFSGGLL